jgi:hypothetical protein
MNRQQATIDRLNLQPPEFHYIQAPARTDRVKCLGVGCPRRRDCSRVCAPMGKNHFVNSPWSQKEKHCNFFIRKDETNWSIKGRVGAWRRVRK